MTITTPVDRDDSHLTDLERAAKALVPDPNWYPWIFQAIENGILCTGAVCPPIMRGPRKGQPNYRKAGPRSQVVIVKKKASNEQA